MVRRQRSERMREEGSRVRGGEIMGVSRGVLVGFLA
jgi:hypothetical protein